MWSVLLLAPIQTAWLNVDVCLVIVTLIVRVTNIVQMAVLDVRTRFVFVETIQLLRINKIWTTV